MEKEINNQSLFADPAELSDSLLPEEKKELIPTFPTIIPTGKNNVVDDPTVEVKFCTGGRLSAPPVLHFRDYTMLASQELADITEDNQFASIVKALNTMVVEDFDCGKLHVEEVKEVLLNIYGKWWGDKLTGYKYLINPDIENEKELLSPENISVADIPLSSIAEEIVPLAPEIKEPINIKCHGVTVKFVYPRIQNKGITADLLKLKFAVQEQQFHKLATILAYNKKQTDPDKMKNVDILELEEYNRYLVEKDKWQIIYLRAHEICAVEDKVLETFEERVEALAAKDSKVMIKHWQLYNDFLEGKGKFGLKNEAEFYSEVLGQKVRRPFQFHAWDFVPKDTVEFTGDVNDEISFG